MSLVGIIFKLVAQGGDKKPVRTQTPPDDLEFALDVSYTGGTSRFERLDVYRPKGAGTLPTILNVHGGGWVSGSKDGYRRYCLTLARQGFAVVNMNYYLAPRRRFPAQLGQINQAMHWIEKNAANYGLDTNNLFIVGDSAGAQLVSQYATILTNPDYARLFDFEVPTGLTVRAVGLNGGTYQIGPAAQRVERKKFVLPRSIEEGMLILEDPAAFQGLMDSLMKDYLGPHPESLVDELDVVGNITEDFPPAYVMTSSHDFLKREAEPMCELLRSRGVDATWRCYGSEEDLHMTHVCNTNVVDVPESAQMNADELEFFKKHVA